jgi:hypothetical protein
MPATARMTLRNYEVAEKLVMNSPVKRGRSKKKKKKAVKKIGAEKLLSPTPRIST